jgi:hypothetical protein
MKASKIRSRTYATGARAIKTFTYRVSPEVNDHEIGGAPCEGSATMRPDCRPRGSPVVRSTILSFTLTLGGVVPPGASRDYFVGRQDLAGLEIRQALDPTVPRGEIDPGEFE